jgi:SAM-dependent methyltransferase
MAPDAAGFRSTFNLEPSTSSMTFADAKQRFSNRVADYIRYRPGYPTAVRDLLRAECLLSSGQIIADIGSGTGFLSELFLKNGNRVFGVEPNEAMRQAGEEYLAEYDNFVSLDGSAEATTLEDASVHFVICGQAFHWFEPAATRREFARILKPDGWVVVVWNERLTDTTPFLREYEALIRKFNTDYTKVNESYPREEQMKTFFGANGFRSYEVPNFQEFDFEGVAGRIRSSSYMPAPDHPNFAPMMDELRRIFDAHNQNGRVRLEYTTRIYLGHLAVST